MALGQVGFRLTMPTPIPEYRQAALEALTRDELAAVTSALELEVPDRRAKGAHLEAMVKAEPSAFGDALRQLSREALKRICEALGLDTSGREKEVIVDRILAAERKAAPGGTGPDEPASESSDEEGSAPLILEATVAGTPKPKMAPFRGKAQATAGAPPKRGTSEGGQVLSYRHGDRRKNNPEVGMVDPDTDPVQPKTKWAYDPHLDPVLQFDVGRAQVEKLIDSALATGDQEEMRRALEQLKRQAQPYLNWTGKAERTSFEVDTVSLHVHERIDPASILAAVRKSLKGEKTGQPKFQLGLFSAPFENLPLRDAIDFYKHDKGWSNRLIAGDSLLVMNSLIQKEGMAGQVQMVFIDPPYGITYGSNFQPFTSKRDVKDRRDEDLTQEPEMIKAFRDTWELGLHSYLAYLRDRLFLAKALLSDSGSIFVQISDENLHHVRELMDDVFGAENFCSVITIKKTGGQTSELLPRVADYLVWYARSISSVKYHQLYLSKEVGIGSGSGARYDQVQEAGGARRPMTRSEKEDPSSILPGQRAYQATSLISAGFREQTTVDCAVRGSNFHPGAASNWKTHLTGMERLSRASRIVERASTIAYLRFLEDFPAYPLTGVWNDVAGAADKVYVVQTSPSTVERCLLMTTDPGDLALDPTCGSGTTAFVAEKWGRRWITCDTSRVAVTLAKQRLMTASYDYFELKYPHEGLKGDFVYKSVPHVTLKSIANNPEIDELYDRNNPAVVQALDGLNKALRAAPPEPLTVTEGGRKGTEIDFKAPATKTVDLPSGEKAPAGALLVWEVPLDFPEGWPASAKAAFEAFHDSKLQLQHQIDASIAAHAEQEILYDQPQPAKDKLRITGPFSVEAVPFPSVLSLDEVRTPAEADVAIARSGETSRQHQWRDELLRTGIRGKGGQLMKFAALEALPDTRYLHTSGTLAETGERVVVSFGPEHGALEQRQVEMAMREAGELFPRPKMIIYAAFAFDPEAAKDIDQTKGIVALKAQMNTDLLTEDLKKARSSNQSFWLMGQPDVDVRKRKDGLYEVEVNGFDYFDTVKGELVSGGKGKIAMWLLDPDYDERSLFPRQVFFPMAGAKDGWQKLRRDIRAELDETRLAGFNGTVSLPFEAGENRKVAVKVVDDRGIESLKIVRLD
jgi:adenine-specific DNA-methyltransferase